MTDLVCGMEINPELCKFRESYKGADYFFCSDACQRAFLKNPKGKGARHRCAWHLGDRHRSPAKLI
jgi:YHS domain-containing protein